MLTGEQKRQTLWEQSVKGTSVNPLWKSADDRYHTFITEDPKGALEIVVVGPRGGAYVRCRFSAYGREQLRGLL